MTTSYHAGLPSLFLMMLTAWVSSILVLLRQSIAVTMHWAPKISDDLLMNEGFLTAVVLTVILSAPALRMDRMPSMVLMPPPTVMGIKTSSAVRSMTSIMVLRPSCEAVISRKTSS